MEALKRILALSRDPLGGGFCTVSRGRNQRTRQVQYRVKVTLLGVTRVAKGRTLEAAMSRAEQWLLAADAYAKMPPDSRKRR